MIDVSGFYENYENYVEFNFGVWGNGPITKSTGFKFLNTGPAQIYGIDGSVSGEGKFLRNGDITFMLGYTYSVPKALEPDLVYHEHLQQSIGKVRQYTYNNTSSDTTGDILKYRMQNVFKSDFQISFRKRFSTGFSGLYYGYMKNIDVAFYQLSGPGAMHSGIIEYREKQNKGNFIVDFRVSYIIKNFKLMLLVNNLFNTEYSIRPITVEAPRLTTLKVVFKI
jgi:outer membrane receptor protein involved in Fe transport